MRGGLRGAGGVVSSPNATTLAGVTPGATGLAVLDDGTPAEARDTVVWASAGAIDPASPYTPIAGVDRVTFGSSKTLAPRALSNYADGQMILVTNSSASTITVTITPADGTIDGGASVALTVLGHGIVGCQRVSASTWVSVQPGSMTANGLRWYVSGGVVYARAVNVSRSVAGAQVITDLGAVVAATTANPDSYTAAASGSDIVVDAGTAGASGALGTHGMRWGWTMADLGITLPTSTFRPNVSLEVTSVTGTRGGLALHLLAGFGTSQTAPQRCNGIYVNSTPASTTIGYAYLVSAGGGVATNGSGATTMTGCINSQNMIIAANPIYWITRIDSGVAAATTTFTSAPAVSVAPTDFVLYLMLDAAGPLTNEITFVAPVGLVYW